MFSLSPLLTFQLALIGLGLIFQFVAFTALKKDIDHEGNEADDHAHDHQNFELKTGHKRRRSPRRDSVHDYYKMEYVPPNVRAGDLRKTAKVTFFDDSTKPPPPSTA